MTRWETESLAVEIPTEPKGQNARGSPLWRALKQDTTTATLGYQTNRQHGGTEVNQRIGDMMKGKVSENTSQWRL